MMQGERRGVEESQCRLQSQLALFSYLPELTDILRTPQPIQSSLPLPLPARAPPVVQSRRTPSKGRTRSVAMYTCVSVSTESMYLILHVRYTETTANARAHTSG